MMTKQKNIILLVVIFVLMYISSSWSQPVIAILDFDKKGDISSGDVEAISEIFRNQVIEKQLFTVMASSKVQRILEEQNFQLTGATDQETAVELGRILNIEKLITGSVSKLGRKWTISSKIIDIETGIIEISKSKSEITTIEQVDDVILIPLANELLADYGFLPDYNVTDIKFIIDEGSIAYPCDANSYPDPEILILHRKSDAIQKISLGDITKYRASTLQAQYDIEEIKVIEWTPKLQNNYRPFWNHSTTIKDFEPGDQIYLIVYDRDLSKHEYIGHVKITDLNSDRYPIERMDPGGYRTSNVGYIDIVFK